MDVSPAGAGYVELKLDNVPVDIESYPWQQTFSSGGLPPWAEIKAVANPGYVFTQWTGYRTTTQNPLTEYISCDKSYVANFESLTTDEPTIAYSPSSFSFSATQDGSNPPSQTLGIWDSGTGTLNWSASDDADWLALSPTSGTSTGETDNVSLSVNISGLGAGSHNATITISATGATNTPRAVSVNLTISASTAHSVNLTATPTERTVAPNVDAVYAITIENTGTAADTFDLLITVNQADVADLSQAQVTLNAGASTEVTLTVQDSATFDYQTTVEAVSQGDPAVMDDVTVTTHVSEGAFATRNLPGASVAPSAQFTVEMAAGGYGLAGRIVETLPAGFAYIPGSASLDPLQVEVAGQNMVFILFGETSFTYDVTASTTPGTYNFAGTLTDFDMSGYTVGGDTEVQVGWDPLTYDDNHDGTINKAEAVAAIVDYFSLQLSKSQVIEVLMLYFSGGS